MRCCFIINPNSRSQRGRAIWEEVQKELEEAGLICSGVSPNGKLVEIVEYKKHPFFIGVQFHPELKSRPNRPAPVFVRTNKSSKRKIKIVLKI